MIRKSLLLRLRQCLLHTAKLALACGLITSASLAQAPTPPATPGGSAGTSDTKKEYKISPKEAERLFKNVEDILNFVSTDTRMPIQHPIKRKLIDR